MAAPLEQISDFSFPTWRHQPGITDCADHSPLRAMKSLVPTQFEDFVPLEHPAFQYGLALHDRGYLWEAHEVWEAVWIAAPQNGRDRIALRALIQIANAGLKASQNKRNARDRLVSETLELLSELELRPSTINSRSIANEILTAPLIQMLNLLRIQTFSVDKNPRTLALGIELWRYFKE